MRPLAFVCFLMFCSHLGWYFFEYAGDFVGSECRTGSVSNECFAKSGGGLLGIIVSIPANIFHAITKFLFGTEMFVFNTILFGASALGLTLYQYRRTIFEVTTTAASYTVSTPNVVASKVTAVATELQNEQIKKEVKREATRADLEEAIEELNEAKARLEELEKEDQ